MTNFEPSLAFVLRWEGGYVNHPDDPGGATNFGVTQKTLDAYCARLGVSKYDVKDIEPSTVAAIYGDGYWTPTGCDRLAWPLCLVHFDTAVNLGPQRAKGLMSASEGDVEAYLRKRRAYYTVLAAEKPKLKVFLRGWLNRMDALAKEAA